MDFFSWKTSDTQRSISNAHSSRGPLPVYLITPQNEKIYEPNYEGFGVFGGHDAYALLARWNIPEECNGNTEHDRKEGIILTFQQIIKEDLIKFPLKFAESPDYQYEELPAAQDDPAKGFYYPDKPIIFPKDAKRELIGYLNLNQEIIIKDPVHEDGSENAVKIEQLIPGQYNVFIDQKNFDNIGTTNVALTIVNSGYPYKEPKKFLKNVPIDTGNLIIYDKKYQGDKDQQKAIMCNTGFGDGDYPIYVRRDHKGFIYAISIIFVKENQ